MGEHDERSEYVLQDNLTLDMQVERLKRNVAILDSNCKLLKDGASHDICLLHERINSLASRFDSSLHKIKIMAKNLEMVRHEQAILKKLLLDDAIHRAMIKIKGDNNESPLSGTVL